MADVEVRFPPHLRRFIELPPTSSASGSSLAELVDDLELQFPGVANYLIHENGTLRQHVNLFVDGKLVVEKNLAEFDVEGVRELVVMQALSGG